MRENIIKAHEKIQIEFRQNLNQPTAVQWVNLKEKIGDLYLIASENLNENDELFIEITDTRNIILNY